MSRNPMIGDAALPAWLPPAVQVYLTHTDAGTSLRELARQSGCHASTVMRQVRRYENRRDDPLIDQALEALRKDWLGQGRQTGHNPPEVCMTAQLRPHRLPRDPAELDAEARRVLKRLAEPDTILAVSTEMDRAAVLREFPDGRTLRLCVVDRAMAQAFALQDWITCDRPGKVAAYRLTMAGKAALKRLMADDAPEGRDARFAAQHRDMQDRATLDDAGPRTLRYNAAESPVSVLGRKKDKDGKPFLPADLVRVAERLREDFEMAQMGPRVAQNWERLLTGADRGGWQGDGATALGPQGARDRVGAALAELGPGLGDVVLRVCCYLEGVEATERQMGWAARSGKIVLRIALQRLKRHYEARYGKGGPRLG